MLDLLISIIKSINFAEIIILFALTIFPCWLKDKWKERKDKKEKKREQYKKDEISTKVDDQETGGNLIIPSQNLEPNTKMWWNLEGWKMDDGWRLGPDPIIPGKNKIHKLTEDKWIG